MITYVDKKHTEAYSILFKDAIEAINKAFSGTEGFEELGEHAITSLPEYFHYMRDLTQIDMFGIPGEDSEKYPANSLRFTRLPIDEDVLEIDANTRQIKVPADFARNGVGVTEDEVAEVLYFTVDRYYDTTDLNEQDIVIEWINADKEKGFSRPYGKDVNVVPGKIVFGWPLSSKITKKEGQITFAVRFYKKEDTSDFSGLTYSLSTLSQTIKINKGIDINVAEIFYGATDMIADDSGSLIIRRAVNSANKNGAMPGEPFISAIFDDEDSGNKDLKVMYIDGKDNELFATIYKVGDGTTNKSFWMKFLYNPVEPERYGYEQRSPYDLDVNNYDAIMKSTEKTEAEKAEIAEKYDRGFLYDTNFIHYTEITAGEAKAEIDTRADASIGVEYYTLEDNKYTQIPAKDVAEIEDNDEVIYRKDCVANITTPGIYMLKAVVQAGNNKNEKNSHYVIVFPPNTPKNVRVDPEHSQKKMEQVTGGDLYLAELTVADDGFGNVPDIEPPKFVNYKASDFALNTADNEVKFYQWSYCATENGTYENIAEDANEQEYIASQEGYYRCAMKGKMNNAFSEEVVSAPFRVAMPAGDFNITISGKGSLNDAGEDITVANRPVVEDEAVSISIVYSNKDNASTGLTVKAEPKEGNDGRSDEYTYEWYKYVVPASSNVFSASAKDIRDSLAGIYKPQLEPDIYSLADRSLALPENQLEGVPANKTGRGAIYLPSEDGLYFCIVTNNYNGDTVKRSSPLIGYDYQEEVATSV